MRILIVSQYFWPESFRISDVAKTLAEKGVHVEVLTGKPNYPGGNIFPGYRVRGYQKEVYEGVTVHRIPLFPRGRGGWRLAFNYLSFVLTGLIFAPSLLRGRSFDAIFVFAPSPILQAIPAIFLGWVKCCPVALWVQDLWPESLSATGHVDNPLVIGLVRSVVRVIYRYADLLMVQSQAFIKPVREFAGETPIVYYPNSVDNSFSEPANSDAPNIAGLGDGFSVVFAGNIGAAQAVDVIIEAASILREFENIHFLVLGEGSRREHMLQEAMRLGLINLHLPGRFPFEAMPGILQRASALLVTLTDQPIFAATVPSKVQAYMAVGRPIIACLNGEGARLVLEAEAGLSAPAEDSKALAAVILELYRKTPEEQKRLGENGRQYFLKHFNHEELVDELIEHFKELIRKERK
ncbi:glycosyltransferase family 4 protein [Methylomonas sp. 2BW1-5-20]|uniref:glycosyltransferase family 4 protein n=1 Tax=Methylomonas sp. 2BW1-5-20 TaxID=3376686 RepID=UPI004050B450